MGSQGCFKTVPPAFSGSQGISGVLQGHFKESQEILMDFMEPMEILMEPQGCSRRSKGHFLGSQGHFRGLQRTSRGFRGISVVLHEILVGSRESQGRFKGS